MNIQSDNTIESSNKLFNRYTTFIPTGVVILAMSYGYMAQNEILMIGMLIFTLVTSNYIVSNMSKDEMRLLNDTPLQSSLTLYPILAPIGITTSTVLLITLLTGNMFNWQSYLAYIVVSAIILVVHKKRLGIE
jgi:hypothetical protein